MNPMDAEVKFPIPKQPLPPSRKLSMDEYLEFVTQLLRNPPPKSRAESKNDPPRRYVRFRLD
jgi:hypothetical protein